jgi:hypothetical protein
MTALAARVARSTAAAVHPAGRDIGEVSCAVDAIEVVVLMSLVSYSYPCDSEKELEVDVDIQQSWYRGPLSRRPRWRCRTGGCRCRILLREA